MLLLVYALIPLTPRPPPCAGRRPQDAPHAARRRARLLCRGGGTRLFSRDQTYAAARGASGGRRAAHQRPGAPFPQLEVAVIGLAKDRCC